MPSPPLRKGTHRHTRIHLIDVQLFIHMTLCFSVFLSHQRTFVLEVMGRHCGYFLFHDVLLGLMFYGDFMCLMFFWFWSV